MAFVNALLSDASIAEVSRQEALDRIYSDPGIPAKLHATESFWLKHGDVKFAQQRSDQLPETAEVVIIGSGITGSSVAHTLLQSYQANDLKKTAAQPSLRPKIVVLEARDICSGATGRNGGHILETAEEYADLKERWGKDTARKITKFRLAHLDILLNVAEELNLGVKSQARRVQFLSVYFDSNSWHEAKERLAIFLADMPEHVGSWGTFEGDHLKKVGTWLSST